MSHRKKNLNNFEIPWQRSIKCPPNWNFQKKSAAPECSYLTVWFKERISIYVLLVSCKKVNYKGCQVSYLSIHLPPIFSILSQLKRLPNNELFYKETTKKVSLYTNFEIFLNIPINVQRYAIILQFKGDDVLDSFNMV